MLNRYFYQVQKLPGEGPTLISANYQGLKMPNLKLGCFKLPKLNLSSSQFQTNPYLVYDYYRASEPVHWGISQNPALSGCWYLFQFSDVLAGLKDPRLGRERPQTGLVLPSPDPLVGQNEDWLIYRDPPYHTGLRNWLRHTLTTQLIEEYKPRLEEYALNLIESFPPSGEVDFISQFAEKFPALALAGLLGFEPEKSEYFAKCSMFMLAPSWQARRNLVRPEVAASRSRNTLSHLLRDLIQKRRIEPRHDLMSHLIATQRQFRTFDEDELVSNALLLLITGYQVAVSLLGNGLLALLENPAQLDNWRSNLSLTETASEELLRYDSPLQMVDRWVLKDLEIGGQQLRCGDRVYLVLGAANRDPVRFSHPHRLELNREKNLHLAFGAGIHTCLGANFVRVQAAVAFNSLLKTLDSLRSAGTPPGRQSNPNFRALHSLFINYTPII